MDEPCDLIARTLTGLEEVLASELQALGATDISAQRRVVHFRGDRRVLYAANLWCRTATRVLKPIHTFSATTDDDLYRSVQQLDWSEHLSPRDTLAINPLVSGEVHTHSLYAAQRTKDAIVDQLRERHGQRPSVDLDNPTLRIGLHLRQSQGTIYLDASGGSLHRRGYRTAAGEAPLSEVLAAGILMLGGWDSSKPLVDFMCGSGTIPIEAALLARRIAPGLIRNDFGYMRWRGYDRGAARAARARGAPGRTASLRKYDPRIGHRRQRARAGQAQRPGAGVAADIVFDVTNYSDVQPPREPGWLVCNPPYDQRLKMAHVENLYRRLGRVLKHTWSGHQVLLTLGQSRRGCADRFEAGATIPCIQRADRVPAAAIRTVRRSPIRPRRHRAGRRTNDTDRVLARRQAALDGRPRDGTGQPFDAHGKALGQSGHGGNKSTRTEFTIGTSPRFR